MPSQLQRSEPNVLFYPLFQRHLVEAERRELERRAFEEECTLAVAAQLSRSPGGGQSPANLSFGSPNPLNSECAVIYSPMPEAAPSSSFLSVFAPLKTVFRASVPTTCSSRATHPTPTAGPPPPQSTAGHSTTQPELNYSSSSSSSTSLHYDSHGPSPQLERHLTVVYASLEGKPDAHTNTSSNPSTSDRLHRSLPPSTEGTQPMDGSGAAAMPSMHSNNSSFAGAVAMVSSMAARLHQQMPWGGATSGGHQRIYVSESATIYGSGTGTAVFNSTPAKALTVPKTPYELVADLLHAHPQLQAYFTLPESAISSPASLGAAFFANKLDSTLGDETCIDNVDESESATDESECNAAPHFVGISPMLHGCEDRCLFETPLWRNPALTVPPSNLGLLVNLRDPTQIPIKFLKSNGSKAYDWARAAKFSAAPMSDSAGLSEAQVFHCLLELRPFSRKSTRLNQAKGVDDKDADGASLRRLATVLNRGGPTKKVEGYGATENTDHQPKKQQRRQPNDNADIITLGDSEGEFSSNGSVASSSSVNKTNERTSVAQSDTSEYMGISIKDKGDGGYTSSSDDDQPVPLHAFKGDLSEAAVMRVDLPIPSYPTLALPCHAVGASVSCSSSQLLSVGYTPVISDYFASLPAYPVVELVRQQFAKSPLLSLSDTLGGLPLHDRTLSAAEASAVLGGSLSLRSPTSPMPPAARRQHQLDSLQHQPSSPVAPQPTGVLARLKSFSEFFAPPPGINDRQKSYEQLSPHNRAPLRSNTKILLTSSPAKDKDRYRQQEDDARKALAQARAARREWRKAQLYRLHRKPPPPPQIMIMKYYNTEAVDSPNMLIRFTRHVTATTADVFAMREMKFYELLAPLFAENSLYFSPHQLLKDGTPSLGGHGHWDSVNRSLSAQQVNNATSPNKGVDDGFGTTGVGCGGATIKDVVRRRRHTLHQQRHLEEQVRMEQFEDEVAARNQSGSLISPNDTVHHDWQGRQHTDQPFASISHQTNYMDPEVNAYNNPKNYNERSASTLWGSGYLNMSPSHKPEAPAAYMSVTSPHDEAILDSTPKASRDATPSQKRPQVSKHHNDDAPIAVNNNSLFGIVQPRWPSTDVISVASVVREGPVPSHQVVTIAAYTSEVSSSSSSSAVSFTSGNELKPKRNRTVLGRILKQFGVRSRRKAAQIGNSGNIPPTALKFESEVDMSKQLRPGGQPHLRTMKALAKGSARIKRFNSISFAKNSMHREEAVPLTMSDSDALPPPPDL